MKPDNTDLFQEEELVLNFDVTDSKPFNKCFKCLSFRNGCSGPNLFAMELSRACEFLQMTRIFLNYSYQYVSDMTGVSLATVKRLLGGKITDPSYFTLKAINDLLLSDPHGKSPCANPDIAHDPENAQQLAQALVELDRAVNDNKDYREALDNIHTSYNAEMQLIREEAKERIADLTEQIARLRRDNDNLWAEIGRRSKMIDMFFEREQQQRSKE